MKIKLVNKDSSIFGEYMSPVAPCKLELITIDGNTVKVDQVEHFVRNNKMAKHHELDYMVVTVKPVVTHI